MFRDVSKHYLISWGCFILGAICLMLNVFGEFFNILFSVFFLAGLISILIKKIDNYNKFKKELTAAKEGLAIDMTLSSSGSFERKNTELTKKQLRELRNLKREKFMPVIVVAVMVLIMIFMTYRMIKGIF